MTNWSKEKKIYKNSTYNLNIKKGLKIEKRDSWSVPPVTDKVYLTDTDKF